MNLQSSAVSRTGGIRFNGLIFVLLFGFLMPVASHAFAPFVPDTMNYQGHLTDSAGNTVNGVVDITFTLYESPSGVPNIWSETHTGVNITDGLFSVELGSTNPLSALPFELPYYLGITIGTDPEMTPRQPLSTAPYAFQAADAYTLGGRPPASYMCQQGDFIGCYTGSPGTKGVGACTAGARSCDAGGVFGACAGEILPSVEVCGNGLDEDCDGVDIACPHACCVVGVAGCADPGIEACVCASDPYCCATEWDIVCVGAVVSLGCGVCP